jgi:hypothetical protein
MPLCRDKRPGFGFVRMAPYDGTVSSNTIPFLDRLLSQLDQYSYVSWHRGSVLAPWESLSE